MKLCYDSSTSEPRGMMVGWQTESEQTEGARIRADRRNPLPRAGGHIVSQVCLGSQPMGDSS